MRSMSLFSNHGNLHQLELISNPTPFQIDETLPDEVSSAEEGEIFDNVSFTSEKVSDSVSYTNEGLTDSELSVIQDTSNTMWNNSEARQKLQDKSGHLTKAILSIYECDEFEERNLVTSQRCKDNAKDKIFVSNDKDYFINEIRSNNDQDKQEISTNYTNASSGFKNVDTTDRRKENVNSSEEKYSHKKIATYVMTNQTSETISKRKSREKSKEKNINPENIDSRIKEKIEKRIKERYRTKDTTPSHTSSREVRFSRYGRSRSKSLRSTSKENDTARSKNKSPTRKEREKCGHRSNSTENRRKEYNDDDNYNVNFSNEHRRKRKSHIHPAEALLTNCKRSRDSYAYAPSRPRYSTRRSITPPRSRQNELKCTSPLRYSNYRSNVPHSTSRHKSRSRSRHRSQSPLNPRFRSRSKHGSSSQSLQIPSTRSIHESRFKHSKGQTHKGDQPLRTEAKAEKSCQDGDDSRQGEKQRESSSEFKLNKDSSCDNEKEDKQTSRKSSISSSTSTIDPNISDSPTQVIAPRTSNIPSKNIKSYLYSVKIPKYLEEERLLRQKIDVKINQYLSNPESHPQYDQELAKFLSLKFNIDGDFKEDDLTDDQKDEWMEFWQDIIKCKYEETFRNERRFLLLQYDVDFADVETYRSQLILSDKAASDATLSRASKAGPENSYSVTSHIIGHGIAENISDKSPKSCANTKLQNDIYKKARRRLGKCSNSISETGTECDINIPHFQYQTETQISQESNNLFNAYENEPESNVSQNQSVVKGIDWHSISKGIELANNIHL